MPLTSVKRQMIRIVGIGLSFTFFFSCLPLDRAFAGRSRAGGGEKAEVDYGQVGMNVGISVGTAVAGQYLSSAWQAASPTTSAIGSGSNAVQVGTDLSGNLVIVDDVASLASKTSTGLSNIGQTFKNLATNTPGKLILDGTSKIAGPWAQGLSSFSSFSQIAPTMVKGYSTYVAASQVGRAVGQAGQYHGWDPDTTFLVTTIATGATAGALNPEVAIGGRYVNPIGVTDILKGTFSGAVGGLGKAGAMVAIDGDKIRAGQNPGAWAQIAGMAAGQAAADMGGTLMRRETWRHEDPKIIKVNNAKPSSASNTMSQSDYEPLTPDEFETMGSDYDRYLNKYNEASSKITPREITSFDDEIALRQNDYFSRLDSVAPAQSVSAQDGLITRGTWDADGNLKLVSEGVPSTAAVSLQPAVVPQNAYKQILRMGNNGLPAKTAELNSAEFERLMADPNVRVDAVNNDGVYAFTRTNVKQRIDTALYRSLIKAPVLDALSTQNWPGLVGQGVSIWVQNEYQDKKWMPIAREVAGNLAQNLTSSIAAPAGLGLDLYVGNNTDKMIARLARSNAIRSTAIERNLDKKLPKADEAVRQRMQDYEQGKASIDQTREGINADLKKNGIDLGDQKLVLIPELTAPALQKAYAELNPGNIRTTEERMKVEEMATESLRNESATLTESNVNFIRSQIRMHDQRIMSADAKGLPISDSQALGNIGTNKFDLGRKQAGFGIMGAVFEGTLKGSSEMLVNTALGSQSNDFTKQLLVPYAVNIATAVGRGVAWYYGWDYTSKEWLWHAPKVNYTRFDMVEPEQYDLKPGDAGFDFVRYKLYQTNYSDDMDRFNRFLTVNNLKSGEGLLSHGEKTKFDLVNKKFVSDPRRVASILFLEERPSLPYAIGRSIEQANMEYIGNTFSFGRPYVRGSIKEPTLGLEPQQVSPQVFMGYLGQLQNIAPLSLTSAIVFNAREANQKAIVQNVGGMILQIPKAPDFLHMQPERLVLTDIVREEVKPLVKKTTELEYSTGETLQDHQGGVTYRPNAIKNTKAELSDLPPRDTIALGVYDAKTAVESTTKTHQGKISSLGSLGPVLAPESQINEVVTYTRKTDEGTETKTLSESHAPYSDSIFGGPFTQNEITAEAVRQGLSGAEPARDAIALRPLAGQLPAPAYGIGQLEDFDYNSITSLTETITTQDGMQTYYLKAGKISSTIQTLRYGGGGLPHAQFVFWAPFPNPLYQLRQQTGPIKYLKNTIPSASNAGALLKPQALNVPLAVPSLGSDEAAYQARAEYYDKLSQRLSSENGK